MGHDHTHPVIVSCIVGIMLYLVITRPMEERLLRMLLMLVLLSVFLLFLRRYLELP